MRHSRKSASGSWAGRWTIGPDCTSSSLRLSSGASNSYWTIDHPLRSPDWATNLAALAVTTTRIRLGTLAVCAQYRSPAVIARQAADVDRLSGGRFVLGLGGGDSDREFAKLGLRFGSAKERLTALRETLEIVRGLWGAEPFSYTGSSSGVEAANIRPQPTQQPRVPILVAGGGEQLTLRLVARYADASNFGEYHNTGGAKTLDDVRRKLAALDTHCRAASRPPESILRTHITLPCMLAETASALDAKIDALPEPYRSMTAEIRGQRIGLLGTPSEAVAYYTGLRRAGLQYFMVRVVEDDTETLRLLSERVIPALVTA